MNGSEFNGSEPATPGQGGAEPQNVTMPLGTGDVGDETALDPLAGARTNRKIGGGTLLIVAVVLIAVAGLFSMRTLTKATAWNSFDSETEKIIEGFLEEIREDGQASEDVTDLSTAMKDEHVLAVLSEPYTERQVALQNVQKNPFIIDQVAPAITPDSTLDEQGPTREQLEWQQRRRQRRGQLEQAGADLKLTSVMDGSVPLAVIEGRIVRVGDTFTVGPIEATFRVKAISADAVKLVAEAPEYKLTVPVTLVLD
ncbi:MAG: hypothetical protein SYC29_12405 [Planctomycetota bacterium]|nr:hypothetical protein [Planctomycetota bacterium]